MRKQEKKQRRKGPKYQRSVLEQTLEQLEVANFVKASSLSYVIEKCYLLRKKKLADFSDENLRIMIGQNMGLKYLVPIAIEKLSSFPLTSGNFEEGALFANVVSSDYEWCSHEYELGVIKKIVEEFPRIRDFMDQRALKALSKILSDIGP